MKTKLLVRFLNRAAHFDADIELADVLAAAVKDGQLASPSALFKYVTEEKHPRLAARQASSNNRQVAVTHLKRTLGAAYIKDLYEEVAAYLTGLLAVATRAGLSPERLVGEHKVPLEINDILRCGSWDGVLEVVSTHLFRRLEEERSTIKLLLAIDKKLDLGMDKTLADAALPYLELRHLLVHADGIADESFCRRFPKVGAVAGERLAIGQPLVVEARKNVLALVRHFDACAVAQLKLLPGDLQP